MIAPSQVKAILFDKDGTLFDFRATWEEWAASLLRRLAPDEEVLEALAVSIGFDLKGGGYAPDSVVIAGTNREIAEALAKPLGLLEISELERDIVTSAAKAPLQPAVPLAPLLIALRSKGYKLGVMTNDSEEVAHAHLGEAKITDHFDFICGADSGYGAKPHPGPLLAFCDRVGVDPTYAVMVGDSTHDLNAASAAGMLGLGVLTGMARAAELAPHADAILTDIGQLPEWLGLTPS